MKAINGELSSDSTVHNKGFCLAHIFPNSKFDAFTRKNYRFKIRSNQLSREKVSRQQNNDHTSSLTTRAQNNMHRQNLNDASNKQICF
jgi:hypothetical protein